MTRTKRRFSTYEINFLKRSGLDPQQAALDFPSDMPVEYIVGKVEFAHWVLKVNSDVLIPRVETVKLIDLAVSEISKLNLKQISIVDVGCGSGAIGLTLARDLKDTARVSLALVDISRKALEVAKENYEEQKNSLDKVTVDFIENNLLDNLPDKFNLIVANLPYIPAKRMRELPSSVSDYEPHLALDGGQDGLVLIKRLISQLNDHSEKQAIAIFEVDDTHSQPIELLGWKSERILDEYDRNRFWLYRKC